MFHSLTLTFDLWRSTEVKYFYAIRKFIHDFLLNFLDTFSQSQTIFMIFDFKPFRGWPWLLTFRGHLRSTFIYTIRKPTHDSLSIFYWHFLFLRYLTSNFWEFDIDLWPLEVNWGQIFLYHSKARIWLPFWLPWTPSLYLVPFLKIALFKGQGHKLIFFEYRKDISSHQMASFEILCIKISSAVWAVPVSKCVESFFLKNEKKHKSLYVGYIYLSPRKFFQNKMLLDH